MFEKQINAGVEFLNENYPGWLDKIDFETLNMVCTSNCILGQIAGLESQSGFYAVLDRFNFQWRDTDNLGFSVSDEDNESCVLAWGILQQEWENKIRELRNGV